MKAKELEKITNTREYREAVWDAISEAMTTYGVPGEGKSNNLAGEMTRAMNRIIYRYYNDGDHINLGYGKETTNAAARFLIEFGNAEVRKTIEELFDDPYAFNSDDSYEDMITYAAQNLLEDLEENPKLQEASTQDMWDWYDADEDKDSYEEDEEEWY